MTTDAEWHELSRQLRELGQVIDHLTWAVEQGQPAGGDPPSALVSDCEAHTTDMTGLVREAAAALQQAPPRNDLRGRQEALVACFDRFNRLWWRYYGESPFVRRRAAFQTLRRQGGGWADWVEGVDDAAEQFGSRFFDAAQAFAGCWNALVDTAAATTVSFTASNIGQEFRLATRPTETT